MPQSTEYLLDEKQGKKGIYFWIYNAFQNIYNKTKHMNVLTLREESDQNQKHFILREIL